MRLRICVVPVCLLLALSLAACASTLSPRAATYGQAAAGDEGDVGETGDSSDTTVSAQEPLRAERKTLRASRARCWSGCGLPCEEGLTSCVLFRAVGGVSFVEGDDPGDSCSYFGADVGRTFCGTECGCWGVDLFYRTHSTRFDRVVATGATGRDAGRFHHLGIKATYERSIRKSRFYWWAGVGPEYFWTDDYQDNDSGFGVFGEAGLGYIVSRNWRVRAGVNLHGFDTDVGRLNAVNDGSSRWLWAIAPVIEIEGKF